MKAYTLATLPKCSLLSYFVGMEQDYFSGPYFITFPAGITESMFSIAIINDDVLEETETFDIIINSSTLPSNVTNGEPGGVVVIIWDNDGRSGLIVEINLIKVAQAIFIHTMKVHVLYSLP